MKTMTCEQLGGACDKKFTANTFEEIGELSEQHGIEMFKVQDAKHLAAMEKMKELMKQPDEMMDWFENKRKQFDALPED